MPIELEDFEKLGKERKIPGTVNWEKVIEAIIQSGEYWTVREIHNDFVHGAVTRFRVMTVLNTAVEEGKLARRYNGRSFYYGAKRKRKRKRKKQETT